MVISRSFSFLNIRNCQRLLYNYQKRCYSYEGDGKTTVTFLNREAGDLLTIKGFNRMGFRLNSGIFIVGPVIMFPKTVLSWNVAGDDDINEESLSLFTHLEPEVDVLVIGLGDDKSLTNQTEFLNKYQALKKMNLNIELLTTEKAISTYNFLCIENRFVAAALIPPLKLNLMPADLFEHNFQARMEGKDDYLLGDDLPKIEGKEKKISDKFAPQVDPNKKWSLLRDVTKLWQRKR